jgi:hypothetical protein
MADNRLYNMLGEVIGMADVVGMDVPAATPTTIPPVPPFVGAGSTVTLPSNTPTGQNGQSVMTLGNVSTNEVYSQGGEFWSGCAGVYSIPALPNGPSSTDACQVIYLNRNNQNVGVAYRDARFSFPNLQNGETGIMAQGSSAKTKWALDGSVTAGTKDSSGNSTYHRIDPNGFYVVGAWGSISCDMNGITFTHASGASLSLGGLGTGLPGPLASLTSFCNINAGMINCFGTTVSLGAGPLYLPAAIPLAPVPFGTPLPPFSSTASSGVMISAL